MSGRRFTPVSEWDDPRHLLGLAGERLALAWLTSCGWSVEAHRFRLGRHDLDLVVRRGRTVAFVEVKTRTGVACGAPVEAVNRRKQAILARVAEVWRLRFGRRGDSYRFDVVSVTLGAGSPRLDHLPDAWRLDGGPGIAGRS